MKARRRRKMAAYEYLFSREKFPLPFQLATKFSLDV